MGNTSSNLDDACDSIGSYLTVKDAARLKEASKDCYNHVNNCRSFWLNKAKEYHDLDPAIFQHLKQPEAFGEMALIRLVCLAYAKHVKIKGQIKNKWVTRLGIPITQSANRSVHCIAVDINTSMLAVGIKKEIQVHSLLRFGDAPLMVIPTEIPEYRQLLLHGDYVFSRPPKKGEEVNAMVHNWRSGAPAQDLIGAYSTCKVYDLLKSDRYIVAYDLNPTQGDIMAYSLGSNSYKAVAKRSSVRGDGWVMDMSINRAHLLLLIRRSHSITFEERAIATNLIVRKFLVALPPEFNEPKIVFPHVHSVLKPERQHVEDKESQYRVFGRVFNIKDIPPPNTELRSTWGFGRFPASGFCRSSSDRALFFALNHQGITQTNFFYNGDGNFWPSDFVSQIIKPQCFQPFGLSIVYAHGGKVYLVSFVDRPVIASP